ncbi:MAG: hypothetical protein QOJ27_2582, partial [Sphingomonadales bacterium]|nr:hypothetical protein [Sphingomonadales bacterium]
ERAEALRQAVEQAVAEGRKVRLRLERGTDGASGGGGEGVFDVNIQTLVKGE